MVHREQVDPLKDCLQEIITKPKLDVRIDWQLQAGGQSFSTGIRLICIAHFATLHLRLKNHWEEGLKITTSSEEADSKYPWFILHKSQMQIVEGEVATGVSSGFQLSDTSSMLIIRSK